MPPPVALPPPSEWEEILRDYYQLGLSTGRHPLAVLRSRLRSLGVLRRRDLETLDSGTDVCVSGLVTHLQHPQTAKGVVFAQPPTEQPWGFAAVMKDDSGNYFSIGEER